ncbi:TetR/AcrR family transcriptional regulator [Agrobacterium rosae]|uniref:TetR/AcrR family transcriptional regulator n=1 Tax=Agrobacterium rosae TaxID=1972867 RepID=UPI001FEE3AA7|nr:TetR/AcrR family transcriptional regulator [Agrobacterium rosae]
MRVEWSQCKWLRVIMKRLTRAEQKALRPTQILEAAFEEFVEHGFTSARVEDIAERVGVTKGTVYVYFSTKEELFAAMIRHIATPFEDILADINQLKGSCADRLRGMILLFYDGMLEERRLTELLRFVISEGKRFPHVIDRHREELFEPLLVQMQTILDEGVDVGEFSGGSRASARILFSPIMAMAVEILIRGGRHDLHLNEYVESHVDLVMGSLVRDRA